MKKKNRFISGYIYVIIFYYSIDKKTCFYHCASYNSCYKRFVFIFSILRKNNARGTLVLSDKNPNIKIMYSHDYQDQHIES